MSYHTGAKCGGVRTLQDIKDRCYIDEGGCWIWRLAFRPGSGGRTALPIVNLPPDVWGAKYTGPAQRVAWIFAGKKLGKGHMVYRAHCFNQRCCNPDHCAAGTDAEMGARVAASGIWKGRPNRAIANKRNSATQTIPASVVQRGEAMFQAGATLLGAAAELGIGKDTARKIMRGTHMHSTNGQGVVANASVFAWRGGSREAA